MLASFISIPLNGKESSPKGNPIKPKRGAPQEGHPELKIMPAVPPKLVALLFNAFDLTISLLKISNDKYMPNKVAAKRFNIIANKVKIIPFISIKIKMLLCETFITVR